VIRKRGKKWENHVTCIGGKRNACMLLVGKPVDKRTLRKPGPIWEDNIKTVLKETE